MSKLADAVQVDMALLNASPPLFTEILDGGMELIFQDEHPIYSTSIYKPEKPGAKGNGQFRKPLAVGLVYRASTNIGTVGVLRVGNPGRGATGNSTGLWVPYVPYTHTLSIDEVEYLVRMARGDFSMASCQGKYRVSLKMPWWQAGATSDWHETFMQAITKACSLVPTTPRIRKVIDQYNAFTSVTELLQKQLEWEGELQ